MTGRPLSTALLCGLLVLSSSNVHAVPGSGCVGDDFLLHRDTLEAVKVTVSDSALAGTAGVQWWTKLTELNDIDGDGLVDPILVYRFYASDNGKMLRDPYGGRLKMIAFHRDAKAAIRAVTGDLDLQRSTTASASYFKLPPVLQTHLVRKMKRMYDEQQFGFDNSHAFKPQK